MRSLSSFSVIVVFATIVFGVIGWGMNISKFIMLIGEDITTMFIARLAGILLAPLGAILGYM